MPLINYKEGESSWVRYIKLRIKQNKNFICFVSGQTGSGKSETCLGIAHALDPEFEIDRICFSALELMELIDSGKLKKGSVIVLEEMGIQADAHKWQSTVNRMLKYLMETFRYLNFVLLMNAPSGDFVDRNIRKLLHAEFECKHIDEKKKRNIVNPKIIQYNPQVGRTGKFYRHHLKVIKDGDVIKLSRWAIDRSPMELVQKYEAKKHNWNKNLHDMILKELREDMLKNQPKPLTNKQNEIVETLKTSKSVEEVCTKLDITPSYVYAQMKLIEKKGHTIDTIKEPGKNRSVGFDIQMRE